jgi:hypothetical protein
MATADTRDAAVELAERVVGMVGIEIEPQTSGS